MSNKLAIIGGTGLTQIQGLEIVNQVTSVNDFGTPSAPLVEGKLGGTSVYFLARHGHPHVIPPHKINYRANINALKEHGVGKIIAVNAVGGINPAMGPEHVCIPHQVVDYTWGREHTFFDGLSGLIDHVDFTHPYDETLRQQLITAAEAVGLTVSDKGVYGATQGPRLESIAEIDRLERDGCDLVGMTGMPEVALAREIDIDYASVCLVVNMAAGRSEGLITIDEIKKALGDGMDNVVRLLEKVITQV